MGAADPRWPQTAADFLAELAQHNTREWFQANKRRQEQALAEPAARCLDALRMRLTTLCGVPVSGRLFRLARDMRFAKGAAPYHVWLRMAWRPAIQAPGYFLSIEPTRVCFGVGCLDFDANQLAAWRAVLPGRAGAAFDEAAAALQTAGWRIDPPALKRTPGGIATDAPRAHWLRYKQMSVWRDADAGAFASRGALEDWCLCSAAEAAPLRDWLARHLPAGSECAPRQRPRST